MLINQLKYYSFFRGTVTKKKQEVLILVVSTLSLSLSLSAKPRDSFNFYLKGSLLFGNYV